MFLSIWVGYYIERGGWPHSCPVFTQWPVITISSMKKPPFALKVAHVKLWIRLVIYWCLLWGPARSTKAQSGGRWWPGNRKESALERDSTVDFFHKLNLWSWMFDFTSGGCESLFGTNSQRESSPECFSISVFRVPSGCVASSVGVV